MVVSKYNTESSWTQEESKAAFFNGVTRAKQSLKASACSNNMELFRAEHSLSSTGKEEWREGWKDGEGEYSIYTDIEKGHNPSSPQLH